MRRLTPSHLPSPLPRRFWFYLVLKILLGALSALCMRKLVADMILIRFFGFGISPMMTAVDPLFSGLASATPLDCLTGVADADVCLSLHESPQLMNALSHSVVHEKEGVVSWWPWAPLR